MQVQILVLTWTTCYFQLTKWTGEVCIYLEKQSEFVLNRLYRVVLALFDTRLFW